MKHIIIITILIFQISSLLASTEDEIDKILASPLTKEIPVVKKSELKTSILIITSIYDHLWSALLINDERKSQSIKCMKQMKHSTLELKKLYSKTQTLPVRTYSELYTVFGGIWSCFSCRKTALEECADAAIALQKAREEAKLNGGYYNQQIKSK